MYKYHREENDNILYKLLHFDVVKSIFVKAIVKLFRDFSLRITK